MKSRKYNNLVGELLHLISGNRNGMKDTETGVPAIGISLREAARDPALARTMRNSLDEASLNKDTGTGYSALVSHCNHRYRVTGTYREWLAFFGMDPAG